MISREALWAPRTRRLFLYAGAQYLSRLGGLLVTLFTIPMAYRYLGPDRFGVWMTISSFTGLLAFADFGLGNGLVNVITAANARGDTQALRAATGTGYLVMLLITLLLGVAAGAALSADAIALVFRKLDRRMLDEAAAALLVFVFCFLANLPLGLVTKLQHGLQRGYVGGIWQGSASVATVVAVPLAIRLGVGLPGLVACLYVPQTLAHLGNTVLWFSRHAGSRPAFRRANLQQARTIVGTGVLFFVLQLAAAVAYQSDTALLASMDGPQAVTQYSVVQRVFLVLSMVVSMSISGLWPSYGDALARRDYRWVLDTFRTSFAAIGVFGLAACAGVWWGFDSIAAIWLHAPVAVPRPLVTAFALWTFIDMLGTACAAVFNAAGVFVFQVTVATAMAAAAFAGKLYLIPMYGPAGAVGATIVAYLLISASAQFIFLRRYLLGLRRAIHRPSPNPSP